MLPRLVLMVGFSCTAALAQDARSWIDASTGIEFVRIEKGCFSMGLPPKTFADENSDLEYRARTEAPDHQVCLDAYWLARHEVTEGQWQAVMGSRRSPRSAEHPVTDVSWDEAQVFLNKLNQLSVAGGGRRRFRLPTEAEWERACRAGAPAQRSSIGWDKLYDKAWFSSNYGDSSGRRLAGLMPVGGKAANAWGLHDMLGNAWEWVADGYQADAYTRHALFNPLHVVSDGRRVIRGGSIRTSGWMLRCEMRGWLQASDRMDTVGLRLATEDER